MYGAVLFKLALSSFGFSNSDFSQIFWLFQTDTLQSPARPPPGAPALQGVKADMLFLDGDPKAGMGGGAWGGDSNARHVIMCNESKENNKCSRV